MKKRGGRFGGTALIAALAMLLLAAPAKAQQHEPGGMSHGGAGGGGHGMAPHSGYSHNLRPPGVPPGPHSPGFASHSNFRPGPRENDFHGRDFHGFGPHEMAIWRGGHWYHQWHDGRYGWWWWAGGYWYFYPVPIYPYPTYVSDVVVATAPDPNAYPPPAPENGAPPPQFWYYCDAAKGYYPYVSACPSGWQEVPAKPAGTP